MDTIIERNGRTILQHHTCGYCGQPVDPNDLEAHILHCEKHPAGKYAREAGRLRRILMRALAAPGDARTLKLDRRALEEDFIRACQGEDDGYEIDIQVEEERNEASLLPPATIYTARAWRGTKEIGGASASVSPMILAAAKPEAKQTMKLASIGQAVGVAAKAILADFTKRNPL